MTQASIELSLNVFTEFADKNICQYNKRARTCSSVHASVIYQIPWNHWIWVPFRENNGYDTDAWCEWCKYKSMWAITSVNADADAGVFRPLGLGHSRLNISFLDTFIDLISDTLEFYIIYPTWPTFHWSRTGCVTSTQPSTQSFTTSWVVSSTHMGFCLRQSNPYCFGPTFYIFYDSMLDPLLGNSMSYCSVI